MGAAQNQETSAGFWVLFATVSAASMAFVASTSLNVALPAIQRELNARGADLIWISNAYVLVQASLIVVCGSLGDHYGRNRICLIGIALFVVTSIVCGFASDTGWLIAGRFAMGFGSAMIVPNSLAIVAAYYSQRGQGKAIGIWSGLTLLMTGLAPLLGGVLAELGMWRFLFFAHVPLGVLAALFLIWRVPESFHHANPPRISVSGALLLILGLGGVTYGFIESSEYGFDSLQIALPIVAGLAALAWFLKGEWRSKYGILPLSLFRSRMFSGANLIALILLSVLSPAQIYLPLNLIQIQGYSASFTGVAILPLTFLVTIASIGVGGIVDRHGPRLPIMAGLVVTAAGFAGFALAGLGGGQETYLSTFFLPIALFGIGSGLALAPLAAAAMASASTDNAGVASGVHNTVGRGGQVLAIGILGGLAISFFGQRMTSDPAILALPAEAQRLIAMDVGDLAETAIPATLTAAQQEAARQVVSQAFVETFSVLMWIGFVFCLLSALLTLWLIERRLPARHEDFP